MTGVLYHTPAEIIAQLIDDLNIADLQCTGTGSAPTMTGWTVFPEHIPESPDQVILVKNTMGRLHRREHVGGVTGEHYGIQILTRSAVDPATPYRKLKNIQEYFDTQVRRESVTLYDYTNATYRTYRVNAITRVSPAAPAGNDGRRFFFSGNMITSIELA